MFEKQIHPSTKEEYVYQLSTRIRSLDQLQWKIMEFCRECNINYIYWNGWFYFKTVEDYATIMLII